MLQFPPHHRPFRGAIKLAVDVDVGGLRTDLARVERQVSWKRSGNSRHWAEIRLRDARRVHPLLESCAGIASAVAAFPAEPTHVTLKLLEPGGFVHPHRDLRGSTPIGSLRVHLPITTHPGVEFTINGRRIHLREGEAWALDTSYVHSVRNASPARRVHLVVDLRVNPALARLLPPRDVRDRLHEVHFATVCFLKGISRLNRQEVRRRVRELVRLWNR